MYCFFIYLSTSFIYWLFFFLYFDFISNLFMSWRQHPTRHQLFGHLPPITKTILVRRTRHAGHCWRSRDELISYVLQWAPTYGRAKAGRPARTYIQQLSEDTGCGPVDLPEAMNDRENWREGQGYPCLRHDKTMIHVFIYILIFICIIFYLIILLVVSCSHQTELVGSH